MLDLFGICHSLSQSQKRKKKEKKKEDEIINGKILKPLELGICEKTFYKPYLSGFGPGSTGPVFE